MASPTHHLLLVVIVALASCSPRPIPVLVPSRGVVVGSEASRGEVRLAVGDTLTVRLAVEPGTGYGWYILENDAKLLEPVGLPKFEKRKATGNVGGGEEEVFVFRAKAAGMVHLLMHCRRASDKEGDRVYSVSVQIGGK